jgi:hypothetical protein
MILIRVHEADGIVTHRVEVFPASIGRSMHCSVRIDEPSVSAHHAELHATEDGYILRDMASTNGLYLGDRRLDSITLATAESVSLGNIRLDIITEDHIEKTAAKKVLPSHATFGVNTPIRIGLAVVFAYVVLGLTAASDQYEVFWPPDRYSTIFRKGFLMLAPVVLVALLISLFCKLNAKRFYFYQVLLLIVSAALATKICIAVAPTLTYNLHQLPLAGLVGHLGNGLIAFWLVFRLQRYVFQRLTVNQRALIAGAAGTLAICVTQIQSEHQRNGERPTMAPIGLELPPTSDLKPNADDLFFDLALSITAVDQQRIKILEAQEAERSSN